MKRYFTLPGLKVLEPQNHMQFSVISRTPRDAFNIFHPLPSDRAYVDRENTAYNLKCRLPTTLDITLPVFSLLCIIPAHLTLLWILAVSVSLNHTKTDHLPWLLFHLLLVGVGNFLENRQERNHFHKSCFQGTGEEDSISLKSNGRKGLGSGGDFSCSLARFELHDDDRRSLHFVREFDCCQLGRCFKMRKSIVIQRKTFSVLSEGIKRAGRFCL